ACGEGVDHLERSDGSTARIAGVRQVDAEVVRHMRAEIEGETDEVLTRQFGISYNTWCKVRSGNPIRRSVADRLEARIRPRCRVG
ncbi:hypothetical protein, partial [Escherichia coli]|uniref:hypothetical protein n=1 Tax=Escherichia coli TaxID=562 RepID=UPI001BE4DF9A